jgi:uncharacterized membrane protein
MKLVLYLCALTAAALAHSALAQITITEIPVLPGYTQSTAFAVSADGQTIGGISAPGTNMDLVSNPVPMIWTAAGGSQLLPGSAQQPNTSGYCYAISSSGGHIAGRLGPANIYRWTPVGGIESLPTVDGTTQSIALGISRDGAAVVGHSLNSPTKPYIWTSAGGTQVLSGGDTGGTARAANSDGSVVAGGLLVNFSATWATRWVNNQAYLFALNGASYGTNAAGDVIVGHYTPPGVTGRATRWTFNGLTNDPPLVTDLGTTPGPSPETRRSLAQGVTDDGQVVVGYALRYIEGGSSSTYPKVAFIWTEAEGMQELGTYLVARGADLGGWELREAKAITPDGQFIVGTGLLNGVPRGFRVQVVATNPCGTSDFNGDGDFGTDQDIEAFFACLGGQCCATCFPGGSDFNGDGDFGTDQDIESFFRVLGGAAC